MARGNSSYFHYIHFIAKRQRGFTLLELVIAVSVMSILIAMAAPSFSQLIETNKIKRLATEVEWLLVQAKSEAVMRGENVDVIINGAATTHWSLVSKTASSSIVLGEINSSSFGNIVLNSNFASSIVEFNKLNGRPNIQGRYSFNNISGNEFRIIINRMTGRIYTCSVSQAIHTYSKCG
ncbi:GspH/FimT family pseudopilin [Photobacterium leiognathi subsp. mandapamensis]|uniref:GspH/FimT family pseudopilin n=1 Tax=Photobacterium leiognathi TaxID=553611 RepID=UPI002980F7A9|nr:GspH/FimT family pseudopilin [Photobacterium leiognathi]